MRNGSEFERKPLIVSVLFVLIPLKTLPCIVTAQAIEEMRRRKEEERAERQNEKAGEPPRKTSHYGSVPVYIPPTRL
jgi:hypothetical protein